MKLSGVRDFSSFGRDTREMIVSQLQAIELEKIGPRSIATVGKNLIRVVEQSHRFQEEVDDQEAKEDWIAIREMSLIILEHILTRFQELSDKAEIAEWDRSSVIGLLADITKVCHTEQKRLQAKLDEGLGKEISDDLINEVLGI